MKHFSIFCLMLSLPLLMGCGGEPDATSNSPESPSAIAPGQVWKYNTRSGEEESTVTIFKIDTVKDGAIIVHVSLDGLHVKNENVDGGISEDIGHLPFFKDPLVASLTYIQEEVEIGIADGYNDWKTAFDTGEAGAWDMPVSKVVEEMERLMNPATRREGDEVFFKGETVGKVLEFNSDYDNFYYLLEDSTGQKDVFICTKDEDFVNADALVNQWVTVTWEEVEIEIAGDPEAPFEKVKAIITISANE